MRANNDIGKGISAVLFPSNFSSIATSHITVSYLYSLSFLICSHFLVFGPLCALINCAVVKLQNICKDQLKGKQIFKTLLINRQIKTVFKVVSLKYFPLRHFLWFANTRSITRVKYHKLWCKHLLKTQYIHPDKIHQNVFFDENPGETSWKYQMCKKITLSTQTCKKIVVENANYEKL